MMSSRDPSSCTRASCEDVKPLVTCEMMSEAEGVPVPLVSSAQ